MVSRSRSWDFSLLISASLALRRDRNAAMMLFSESGVGDLG